MSTWRILRTTRDLADDTDWVADGTVPDPVDCIRIAELRRSQEGRFSVRTAWVDDTFAVIDGYGTVELQAVTVDDLPEALNLVSIGPSASLSSPPVTTARTPTVLDAPLTGDGLLTIRCTGMVGPVGATRLRIWVETVDP